LAMDNLQDTGWWNYPQIESYPVNCPIIQRIRIRSFQLMLAIWSTRLSAHLFPWPSLCLCPCDRDMVVIAVIAKKQRHNFCMSIPF
jgi:hypothetical protein